MGSQLPTELQFAVVAITTVLAIAVGVVTFFQWRTAHLKVILDLWDRRYTSMEEINEAVRAFVGLGSVGQSECDRKLLLAMRKSTFLFGSEVKQYLERLYAVMMAHKAAETASVGEQYSRLADERHKNSVEIHRYLEDAEELFAPYLRVGKTRWLRLDLRQPKPPALSTAVAPP